MKGPTRLPNEIRYRLYRELVLKPLDFTEKDIALFSQNARFDPRFAEVLTTHLRDYWWKYDPSLLNKKLKAQPWPASLRPLLNQILLRCEFPTSELRAQYSDWLILASRGIAPVKPQLYFESTLPPRSRSLDREVFESLPEFSSVGFYAKDLMFNKGLPGTVKAPPTTPKPPLRTEDFIKLNLFLSLRPLLSKKTLAELSKATGFDQTTLSEVRQGKLDQLSLRTLSELTDRMR